MPDEKEDISSKSKMLETKADVKLLYETETPLYKLHLEIRHRGIELWGNIKPSQKGDIIREKDLLNIFKEHNVSGEIERENFKMFCAKACLGHVQENVLLIKGVEPQKGRDEWIEFLVRPSTDKPRYVKDEHGNIDYANLHLFDNAMPGQLICQTRPPEDGIPGISVTGEPIQAPRGLPLEPLPKEGTDIRMEKETNCCKYFARMPGRVVYENNSIAITDKYVVDSDVDLNVGHIDFVGHVEIKGDVVNDFNVKAGKSLTVKGNIGVCHIESGGDITIGGMSGDERGTIKCGGNLAARYLNSAIIECKGNISVKNEIVNCKVKCGGIIDVNLGAIVGGECTALAGIEARIIGSEIGVKTKLICGVCYIAEEKKKKIHDELDPATEQIEKISKRLDPVLKNPRVLLGLSQKDRDSIKELAEKFQELLPIQAKLRKELEEIEKDVETRANRIICSRKSIERGVDITLATTSEVILRSIDRPVTIVRNSRNGSLRVIPKHPVTDNARQIDKDLIKQEDEDERRAREKERRERRDS